MCKGGVYSNSKRMLSWGVIRPDTIVNGKGGFNEENLKELQKYTNFASYGDYRQTLLSYYNQLYDQMSNMAKNYNGMENYYNVNGISPNHPHNFIQLTPSGILYIKRTNLYQKIVLRMVGSIDYQEIDIMGLDYGGRVINLARFSFYDSGGNRVPLTYSVSVPYGSVLISNQQEIMNANGNFISLRTTDAIYNFYPNYYYLYLSCNGNPNVDTVIRFSTQLKPVMIIYSEMPIDIVGFN